LRGGANRCTQKLKLDPLNEAATRVPIVMTIILLAGCAGTSEGLPTEAISSLAPAASIQQNETIEADAFTVHLKGEGWGQLRLHLDEARHLRLSHETLDLSSPFSDRDGAHNGDGEYTVVHVADDEGSSTFNWLGRTAGFSGPLYDSKTSWTVGPGNVTITVANSVEGYALDLGASDIQTEFWLDEHDGFFGGSVDQQTSGGLDLGVTQAASETRFVKELAGQPPSYFSLLGWGSEMALGPAPMAHAEVQNQLFGLHHLGASTDPGGVPFPGFGYGSYTDGYSWWQHQTDEADDLQAVYSLRTTGVVVGERHLGLALVVLPLA
jgi:hypothetical protein